MAAETPAKPPAAPPSKAEADKGTPGAGVEKPAAEEKPKEGDAPAAAEAGASASEPASSEPPRPRGASVREIQAAFARIRERLEQEASPADASRDGASPAAGARRRPAAGLTESTASASPTEPRIRLDWRVTLAWPDLAARESSAASRIVLIWR
ncbi:MAG: hypothetical protein R2752_12695 [Vicinamibacterales bacterium]